MRAAKVLLTILLSLATLLSLLSCEKEKNREYDETEVKTAAKNLIEASLFLNEVYYGKGIPIAEAAQSVTQGTYKEANGEYLARHGIVNLKALREMTAKVFSDAVCEQINSTVFESVRDDGVVKSYVRYFEKTTTQGMFIMVDTKAVVYFTGAREYLYDTLEVLGSEGERVKVSLTVRVEDEEGIFHEMPLTVALIEETDGWRLDGPTYMKYNEYTEQL